jgi:predicted phosphodiesterase
MEKYTSRQPVVYRQATGIFDITVYGHAGIQKPDWHAGWVKINAGSYCNEDAGCDDCGALVHSTLEVRRTILNKAPVSVNQ